MFDQAACRMGLPEKEIVVDQCRFQYWNLQPVYQFLEIRGYILLDVNVIKDACQQLKRVLVEDRETALRRQVFDLAQDCAAGANVIGIDWQTSLADARKLIPEGVGLQGNLSPSLISDATPDIVAHETKSVLEAMRGRAGHIFNLGHGLTPGAKLENIAALVATVKGFK